MKEFPYLEIWSVNNLRGKNPNTRQVWLGEYRIKATTCYSVRAFFENCFQHQQLASFTSQDTQKLVKILPNFSLRPKLTAQFLSKLKRFFLKHEAMLNYKTCKKLFMTLQKLQLVLICVQKWKVNHIVVIKWKDGFFGRQGARHWQAEHRDLFRFWLRYYCRSSYKSQTYQSKTEKIPDPLKTASGSQLTLNTAVVLMRNIPRASFWTPTI